jgi:hypothetical protein
VGLGFSASPNSAAATPSSPGGITAIIANVSEFTIALPKILGKLYSGANGDESIEIGPLYVDLF